MTRPRRIASLLGPALGVALACLTGQSALAAPPESAEPPIEIQRPKSKAGPEKLPAESETPAPAPPPEPAPRPEPAPQPAPKAVPATPGQPQQAMLWRGLVGQQLSLSLTGDALLQGELLAQENGQLVLARRGDGAILSVPYGDVKSVQVAIKRERRRIVPRPANNGTGLVVGGGVLLALGTPFAILGGITVVVPGYVFYSVPLILIGGGFIIGGSAAISVGAERRKFTRLNQRRRTTQVGGFGGEHPDVGFGYTLKF